MFPGNQFFGFQPNKLELYPRRRATEFYQERQPLEEYQSRRSEHPKEKLRDDQTQIEDNILVTRIMPPSNSDMRMFRNSYFS